MKYYKSLNLDARERFCIRSYSADNINGWRWFPWIVLIGNWTLGCDKVSTFYWSERFAGKICIIQWFSTIHCHVAAKSYLLCILACNYAVSMCAYWPASVLPYQWLLIYSILTSMWMFSHISCYQGWCGSVVVQAQASMHSRSIGSRKMLALRSFQIKDGEWY